ncbi:MAG TPA: hypothetical protein VMB74_11770 [Streptosporangiaceae bacterium]|nr:hypothetical protein [Streptosporangiaceae bacterium]
MAVVWRLATQARDLHRGSIAGTAGFLGTPVQPNTPPGLQGRGTDENAGETMTVVSPAAMPPEMRTRVVCRIFIKATPEDVRDAICLALKQDERAGSDRHSVELRDTQTGYTSLTVSCGLASCPADRAPGPPAHAGAGAYAWERLLGDLKTVLEAAGRDRSARRPLAPAPAAASPARSLVPAGR